MCKCKCHPSVDEHVDRLFNCHFFTAEVKDRHDAIVHEVRSLSQHAAKTSDGPIRRLNIKSLHLDVTIANPTPITYLNRGSSQEEHVAFKDKERLKNEKYSQRCQVIESDFMPVAYGACSEKFEDFLKKMVKQFRM